MGWTVLFLQRLANQAVRQNPFEVIGPKMGAELPEATITARVG